MIISLLLNPDEWLFALVYAIGLLVANVPEGKKEKERHEWTKYKQTWTN